MLVLSFPATRSIPPHVVATGKQYGRVWLPACSPTRPARDVRGLFGCLGCMRFEARTDLKAARSLARRKLPNRQFLASLARRGHACEAVARLGQRGRRRRRLITRPPLSCHRPGALFPPLPLSPSPPLPLLSSDGSASPTVAPSSDPRRPAHRQHPGALAGRAPELGQGPGVGAVSVITHLLPATMRVDQCGAGRSCSAPVSRPRGRGLSAGAVHGAATSWDPIGQGGS